MAGQRLVDPSDPQSVARMLKRIDTLEQKVASVTAKHKRLQRKFSDQQEFAEDACSNIQFTAVDATHVSYSSGFVRSNTGQLFQVTGASVVVAASTNINLYAFFSPTHKTLQFVTDASLQDALSKRSQIYVAAVRFAGFAAPKPATASTYPSGSTFGLA